MTDLIIKCYCPLPSFCRLYSNHTPILFIAQAFNIFNKDQLADPNLLLNYNPPDSTSALGYITPSPGFGQITSLVNVNSNSDKFAADNTGSGLPRELQFAIRLKF